MVVKMGAAIARSDVLKRAWWPRGEETGPRKRQSLRRATMAGGSRPSAAAGDLAAAAERTELSAGTWAQRMAQLIAKIDAAVTLAA